MTPAMESLRAFSVLSFLIAGLSCLRSPHMKAEFDRYGLSEFRRLTGALQLAGSAGLVVGLVLPVLTPLAAGGLCLLMLLGVVARLRVHDSLFQITPAATLSVANLILLSLSVATV
jgi:uncharacterized membrane protein YphA (DoxX/SURF4 family)